MDKINRILKKHHYAVFMDFEGTQFSHEMIAIGAVVCTLNKDGTIKHYKKPFKTYVKAKNKIGTYVMNLTGITQELLDKKGVLFSTAMKEFKKYCGYSFSRAVFITFGNHDLRILSQSIAYNLDAPKEICSQIQKNYVDFQPIISEFVRDDNYNPMSLVHYLEVFNIKESGQAHDPEVDAVNLAYLFDGFVKNKELVLEQYMKVLQKMNNLPAPVKSVISKLAKGETVTGNDLRNEARKYIK